jgi:hypothetical protein
MATKKSMQYSDTLTKAQYIEHICNENKDNPVFIRDEKCSAIWLAYKHLYEVIITMDKENLLSEEDKNLLVDALEKVFMERKAKSYLSTRLDTIAQAIEQLIEFNTDKRKDIDFYYCNSIIEAWHYIPLFRFHLNRHKVLIRSTP